MKKVLILDTSVLCVWLEIPGMEDCGRSDDRWDKSRMMVTDTNKIKVIWS